MSRFFSGAAAPFLLVAASTCWGAATVLNKALLASVSPQLLLVLQLLPSAMVLWACCCIARCDLPRGRPLWLGLALGVLNPGISYSLSLLGLDRIPAGVAALLWSTEPFMILALAAFVLAEPVTPRLLAVIATGFIGAGLATGAMRAGSAAADATGFLYLLSAVFLCAIYTVFSRRLSVGVDPLPLLTLQMSAGLAWAVLALWLTGSVDPLTQLHGLATGDLLAATLTGLIYYALAYWLYLLALRHVSAATAGTSFNIIPLVAVSGAFLFLGERLNPMQMLGGGLIMLSVFLLFRLSPDRATAA